MALCLQTQSFLNEQKCLHISPSHLWHILVCLIDRAAEWPSISLRSSGLTSLTNPRTASSAWQLPCSFQTKRLLHKFAGKKHTGSDRCQSGNRGFATKSGLRSVTLELNMKNPNKKCYIFAMKFGSYKIQAFQAMSKLVILFFFCTKCSLNSLQKTFPKSTQECFV